MLTGVFNLSASEARAEQAQLLTPRRPLIGAALPPALPTTAAELAAGAIGPSHLRVITALIDRSPGHNEQHHIALGHHPTNATCPRRVIRSGACTHLLIAGSCRLCGHADPGLQLLLTHVSRLRPNRASLRRSGRGGGDLLTARHAETAASREGGGDPRREKITTELAPDAWAVTGPVTPGRCGSEHRHHPPHPPSPATPAKCERWRWLRTGPGWHLGRATTHQPSLLSW